MAFEDMSAQDQHEMMSLRKMLYRAVMELEYVHDFAGMDVGVELIASAEGKDIVESGMKLLGVADLSEEHLPHRLLTA